MGVMAEIHELPVRPPSHTCNARLARGSGYCTNEAGKGTDHRGFGRCKLHGGSSPRDEGLDGPRDLFHAIGLGEIIDLAETMTRDDQEYLMDVGTNALTVTRAKIVAKMQDPTITPKELNDLSMALTRIEKVLESNPNDLRGQAEQAEVEDDELARVLNIEKALGG